ncbi:MAG: nucleoid-associated protein [bacterium]
MSILDISLRIGGNNTMRDIKDLTIIQAILHILDNQNDFIKESDFLLTLNEKIIEFLKKHILNSLDDDKTRAANFITSGNIVKNSCNAILNSSDCFVEESKKIANSLFLAMSNKTISPADLLVVNFESNKNKYIALLKMDYNEIYKHVYEETDDGKIKTDLVIDDSTSLPNLNQKLQKSAFIQSEDSADDYEIIILDKQASSKSAGKDIAQFFLKSFLNAKLEKDDKYKTQVFIQSTIKYLNNNVQDSKKRKEIINYMYDTLNQQSEINIRDFANIFDEQDREEYLGVLFGEKLADYEFKPDESILEKHKKIVLETNQDIKIRMSKVLFDDKKYFQEEKLEDGSYKISIYTDGYKIR